MAHRKSGGSTELGRDSNPKYLGIKLYGGQKVKAGSIIVKQRGTKFRAGKNVYRSNDDSLHAKIDGTVKFIEKRTKKYNGKLYRINFVNVI